MIASLMFYDAAREASKPLPKDELAGLPLDVVYCLFDAFEPATLLSFALTNKNNLLLLSCWLDKHGDILKSNVERAISAATHFRLLCQTVGQVKDRVARKQIAAILRDWQTKLLTERGELNGRELADWNVCNGCLRFKKQHSISCTRCQGPTCENFVCNPYCVFF